MRSLNIWIMVLLLLFQQLSAQTYTDYNFKLNKITSHLGYFPNVQGAGMVFSIKDANIDTSLADLESKKIYFDLGYNTEVSSHASQMALLTTSRGIFSGFFKGIAPSADLHISSSKSLLPNFQNTLQSGAKLQLHPYGTGIENYYGLDASAYDAMMEGDTAFLHIFSAGNSGTLKATGGIYDGLKGWSNLTGNFKQSKNALVVGALDEDQRLLDISSSGPSYDGRVKPEIVAYGEKGTSESAAIVAGGLLLMQELYKKQHGSFPSSALLKSAIIASAKPVNDKILSFKTGYGNFDHLDAMRLLEKEQYLQGEIQANEIKEFSISFPDGIEDLRFALTWIDPHAPVNVANSLINDLDFKVIDENDNVILPLVLNNIKNQNSLNDDPINKQDHVNNVELIYLKNPTSGNLRLIIESSFLKTSSQKFYIAYSFKQSNTFEWHCAKDSIVYKENILSLIWTTTYKGSGEYGYIDSLGNKRKIENIDLSSGNLKTSFDYSGKAKFYMKIGDREFVSKEYFLMGLPIVSHIIKTNGLLIVKHVKPIAAAVDAYYMDGAKKFLAGKNLPQYSNYTWVPSKYNTYWLNYQFSQYRLESIPIKVDTVSITSFIDKYNIQNEEKKIQFSINLLMIDLMDSVFLKKKVFAKAVQVDSVAVKSGLLILKDSSPLRGLNNYYLEIKTKLQSKPFIEDLKYFYISGQTPVIYPNPVSKPACIQIRFEEPLLRTIQVMNMEGKLLATYKIESTNNRICLPETLDHQLILQVNSGGSLYSTIIVLK
jgi:Subtilase family